MTYIHFLETHFLKPKSSPFNVMYLHYEDMLFVPRKEASLHNVDRTLSPQHDTDAQGINIVHQGRNPGVSYSTEAAE